MEKTNNFLKENLLRLRNKAGMTQSELADLAKITLTGYQKIEYGKSKGKAGTISKIAKALGVTVEQLERDPSLPEPAPMTVEFQVAQALERYFPKAIRAAEDAAIQPTVPKQDARYSEKDELIARITALLPLLNINNLNGIRRAVERKAPAARLVKKAIKPGL